MDNLMLAQQRYSQIAPLLLGAITVQISNAFEAWIVDQVCPVVDQLCKNRRFQLFARWSSDHLPRGVESKQRPLVEAVDSALTDCAKTVLKSASHASDSLQETLRAGALAPVQWIAERPWFDLVCLEEYFDGSGGLHSTRSNAARTAEYWARNEPRVPLGDYVARAMFLRIEYFSAAIQAVWQPLWLDISQSRSADLELCEMLFSAKIKLDEAITALKDSCYRSHDFRLRDACVTLTQVYAAYSPNPDLGWLGCPPGFARGAAITVPQCLRPVVVNDGRRRDVENAAATAAQRPVRLCVPEVIQGIASALVEITGLYRRPIESEEAIAQAREVYQLVMVDQRPRCLFWQGEPVHGQWDKWSTRWDLLWRLAQRAQRSLPVCRDELANSALGGRAVTNRRHHLSKSIPAGLNDLIEDVRPGGYRLKLPSSDILLLELDNDEQLVEVAADSRFPAAMPS